MPQSSNPETALATVYAVALLTYLYSLEIAKVEKRGTLEAGQRWAAQRRIAAAAEQADGFARSHGLSESAVEGAWRLLNRASIAVGIPPF